MRTNLGAVCTDISYGVTTSAADNRFGPRLLRITDIGANGVDWDRVPGCFISEVERRKSALEDGDIVIARTGGTVGKSFLVENPPNSVFASYLIRLKPNRTVVLPEYLNLFLGSASYWNQLRAAAMGAAQPNVNSTTLSAIEINVPSTEEQALMISPLKAQLASIEKASRAAEAQLLEVSQLANAFVEHSLTAEVTTQRNIGDVLDEVKQGIGKTWNEFPVLGATRDGLAAAKEPPGKHAVKYKPAFHGTVFYNPMRIMIGSIAFVDDDDEPGITSPDYVVLRGREGAVDSRWFYYWLRSPLGIQCINTLARGAVRERMLFNRLAGGTIELPSYSAQQKASLALKELKCLRAAVQKNLEEINSLSEKILAQAFED